MKDEILSAAVSKGIFFSPDAMEMILSNDHPMEFANTVFAHLARNSMFVSKQDIMDCIAGDKVLFESPKEIKPNNKFTSDLNIVKGTDITGESTCEGKVNDFANYFRARYFSVKRMIEKRNDFGKAMSIQRANELDREVRIVGMIYDKSTTKNGHTMLSVEDDTGMTKVFISKDSPAPPVPTVAESSIYLTPVGRRSVTMGSTKSAPPRFWIFTVYSTST